MQVLQAHFGGVGFKKSIARLKWWALNRTMLCNSRETIFSHIPVK